MNNLFLVGDIIVYDSRCYSGPTVSETGLVVGVRWSESELDYLYKIHWYHEGKFNKTAEIKRKIAAKMSFPRIGSVHPIAARMEATDLHLDLYGEEDQYEIGMDF